MDVLGQMSYNTDKRKAEAMYHHPPARRLVRASHMSIVPLAPVACHRSFFVSTQEVWKDVIGWEGIYQVSDMGRVKRIDTTSGTKIEKYLRDKKPRGYVLVTLKHRGTIKNTSIHSLVADAFIGPRPAGYEINHINGVKDDNRLSNLEYVTPKDNIAHARDILGYRYGYHSRPKKEITPIAIEPKPGRKLSPEAAAQIRALYKNRQFTQTEIGAMFGVSHAIVGRIVRGKAWLPSPREEVIAALDGIMAFADSGSIPIRVEQSELGTVIHIDGVYKGDQGWVVIGEDD